jgi:cyclic beta-1,2-glucan synthetase
MYRIWVEEVLGFRVRGDRFTVEPSLPADWPGFELTYRHRSTVYEITVSRQQEGAVSGPGTTLELDGEAVGFIPIEDSGRTHRITVLIPRGKADNSRPPRADFVPSLVGRHQAAPEPQDA